MSHIIKAHSEHIDAIDNLLQRCKDDLNANKIYQWTDDYPNREYVEECVLVDKEMYVLIDDEVVKGCIVINEWQSEEWQPIPWQDTDSHKIRCSFSTENIRGFRRDPDPIQV